MTAVSAEDRSAIAAHLRGYETAWSGARADGIEAYWDADDPTPVYVAEERDTPLLDWPAIRAYWQSNARLFERVTMALREVAIAEVAPDMASVLAEMQWSVLSRDGVAMAGDNRVFALLRRRTASWRFHAWIEAPLAPLTYMRRLYEMRATVGPARSG